MKSLYAFFICTSFVLTSCDVVQLNSGIESTQSTTIIEGPDTTPSNEAQFRDLLQGDQSKTWHASGFTIAGISGFQDCRLDDSIELFANGTYIYQSGAALCGAEDTQSNRNGTWKLLFSQGLIEFETGTNETFQVVVTGLDSDNIVLAGTYVGLPIKASYQSN